MLKIYVLKLSAFWFGKNYKGIMPIPAKLLLWILSNDWAITALIPWRYGPLAAQSLDDPEPYSAPAKIIVWCPWLVYF